MKRYLAALFVLTVAMGLMVACGGGGKATTAAGSGSSMEVFEDPFQELTDMATTIIESGGVAAVGQGVSRRQDLAKKEAVVDAQGQLAGIFNTKVQRLQKSFQEEIGGESDSEINEAFTTVTKTLTSQMIRGAISKKTKYMRDKETGQFTCAALVAIEPNKVNMSILDEMEKSAPKKLYERFRASQAYDELKKEMADYEKSQNQGF